MLRKGFVDLQVNGYTGVDFSDPGLTKDDVHRVTRDLLQAGTVGYCATLITSDMEVYRRNLPLLAAAMQEPGVRERILGIHLEGPYLSPVEGARGAHSPEKMRLPDPEEFDRLQEWAGGRVRILTLAPELPGSLPLIEHVVRGDATRVALGHHLATRECIRRAVDAGATLCTHLGNGCPNTLPRHGNVLVHQLAEDALHAGLITDGHHLPEDFIRVAFRCKGAERIFVVSDSAPIAGLEAGEYETLGNRVRMTAEGRIESLDAAHLVGSGCSLARCMRYLRSLQILPEEDLWRVGLENPLGILGVELPPRETEALPDFSW